MTTQFMMGDRVRVTEPCCGHRTGDTGTITVGGNFRNDNGRDHMPNGLGLVKIETTTEPENLVGKEVQAGTALRYAPDPAAFFHSDVTEVRAENTSSAASDRLRVRALNGPDRSALSGVVGKGDTQLVYKQYLSVLIPEAPKAPDTIEAGDTVRVKDGSGWSFAGTLARVDRVINADYLNVFPESRPGQDYSMPFADVELVTKAGTPVTSATEVEQLKAELAEAKRKHEADIKAIAERLNQEAEDRDWCGEYDGLVADLNADLYVELPLRKREFEVTFTFTQTVTVEAADEEDAKDRARESDEYMDSDSLNEDTYETSAEEV
jgi:hypothetical protein